MSNNTISDIRSPKTTTDICEDKKEFDNHIAPFNTCKRAGNYNNSIANSHKLLTTPDSQEFPPLNQQTKQNLTPTHLRMYKIKHAHRKITKKKDKKATICR